MKTAPRILHLEDDRVDARLIRDTLKEAGLEAAITHVSNRAEFEAALARDAPDLILSDYRLPGFSGEAALEMSRSAPTEIPFIFVTGALGEELAVSLLRSGATDYVLKDRLSRLAPAIERALAEAAEHALRQHAEEEIKQLNATLEARVLNRTAELSHAVAALETEIAARRKLELEVLEISEREQCRLGQDLHDDLGQRLAGLAMLAHALRVDLEAESQPHAVKAARLTEVANETMIAARALAKSFYPVELERHGFNIATEDLAKGLEIIAGVECETRFDSEFHVGQDAAIHLYRIVQESMTNAVKHGRARRIVISGSARKGTSSLEITDNGIGFQMPAQGASSGIGLHLLGYRARLIGATLEIERASAEGGCRVKCVWECVAENAQDMARESR